MRILTWFWQQEGGRTSYTAEHVNIWADMVRRNISMRHTIACVTDIPEGIDPSIEIIAPPRDFEDVRISTWGPKLPQCLRRIAMYAPDAAETFGERFVCMDLDCAIGGPLDPLFDHDDDFRIYKGTGTRRPYNGSMVQMTAGARSQVCTEFTPERAEAAGQEFLGSDQAWISHVLGWGEKTWGEDDGVYWYNGRFRSAQRALARILFFPGKLKPWDVARIEPYTRAHYRMAMKEAA